MADESASAADFWNIAMETQLLGAVPRLSLLTMLVPNVQGSVGQMMLHYQREALTLLSRRWEADLTFVDKLGGARSAGDLATAWFDFARNAASDYSDTIGRIVTLEIKDAAEVAEASMGEDLRDVALSAQLVA
ncbi:hypothetical protein [Sphingobium olei]|uniref:Phasin family protein n=1 Tax=Sphingobium olei TaxID=420955 RepID=A0ABW3P346_9SPHN